MAVIAKMYANTPRLAFTGALSNLNSEDTNLKVMLLSEDYNPDQNEHSKLSDVESFEIEGVGYSAGGAGLENLKVTTNNGVTTFTADEVAWENATLTAKYAVVYDADADDNPVLIYIDFGEDVSAHDGTFKIVWNANGIFTVSVA